ncbi:hypothetical protein Cni_G14767 [Canna indica]|uniref:SWIM-type domain-containing protein n=1 Tax=Canna indica TaxID=4628 RepID=A0AAQ3KEW5_9LILI|nr:hypothetical protein Cni_G14767 [Canna indica]
MCDRAHTSAPPVFKRLYIGFNALRNGFLHGCRSIIGFDGCFRSAVGRDGNDQIFPIAWVVVEGENYDSWSWFLGLLFDDLCIHHGYGWTLAHQDFTAIGVQKFCQAFISTNSKCETITNNRYILKVRSKDIIDMLEDICRLVMARMQAKRELMLRSNDEICPNIRKKLEKNKRETRFCHVTPAGNLKIEVQHMEKSHVVNLSDRTCLCRYWDISGIPCNHAISCIVWLKEYSDNYVNNYYKNEAYLKTYEFLMEPLTVKDTWPQVEGPRVLPPPVKKMPGRPKKKRRREVHEE